MTASAKTARPRTTATKQAPVKPAKKAAPKRPKGLVFEEMRFKKDYRCFKRGRKLVFRPGVNLIVGEQGTGKSSVLGLIKDLASERESKRTKELIAVVTDSCRLVSFDFEKDSPRTKSYFEEGFSQMQFQIVSLTKSHGQTVNELLRQLVGSLSKKRGEKVLVLLDEPDMALSPRSAHQLARQLAEIAKQGHQVIAAVHNPIVIAAFEDVFSLEHKKWMKSAAFLAAHAEPLAETTAAP